MQLEGRKKKAEVISIEKEAKMSVIEQKRVAEVKAGEAARKADISK